MLPHQDAPPFAASSHMRVGKCSVESVNTRAANPPPQTQAFKQDRFQNHLAHPPPVPRYNRSSGKPFSRNIPAIVWGSSPFSRAMPL